MFFEMAHLSIYCDNKNKRTSNIVGYIISVKDVCLFYDENHSKSLASFHCEYYVYTSSEAWIF